MKVKCINNNECEGNLKVGQVYPVEAEFEEKYKIKLKQGQSGMYLKGRFKEVDEQWVSNMYVKNVEV